jgi:hypothetical protein
MPVKFVNNIRVTKDAVRGEMAEAINRAAREHQSVSRLLAPVDTGFLRRNITLLERATPRKPRAVVRSAASYSASVNYGHRTSNGGFVPAQPFWEEGIERGKEALMQEAVRQARSRGTRRRAGVQHADTPEQLADFFLNEGVE